MSESITPTIAQNLMAILNRHLTAVKKLMQYLDAEKSAIEKRDYDAYYAIAENKKHLLIDIETVERERHALLHSIGVSVDKAGFDTFLSNIPKPWQHKFTSVWDELRDGLNRCRDTNQVNGKILLHAQIASERLLQLVKGVRPNETVYVANGRTQNNCDHRSLALA